MDPNSLYNDPALQAAKQQSQAASQQYLDASKDAITLPDMLRDALNKKFTTNNPLITDMNNARVGAMNSMTSAPLSVLPENNNGIIFSPMQQQDLINQQRNSALSPLMMLNDLFGQQVGGIQNLVDSSGRAFQGQVQGMANKATMAKDNYQTLLDEIKTKAQMALSVAQLAEQVRSHKASEEISRMNKVASTTKSDAEEKAKKDAFSAETWNELLYDENGDARSEWEIWKKLTRDQDSLRKAGADVDWLWQQHAKYKAATAKKVTPASAPPITASQLPANASLAGAAIPGAGANFNPGGVFGQ